MRVIFVILLCELEWMYVCMYQKDKLLKGNQ